MAEQWQIFRKSLIRRPLFGKAPGVGFSCQDGSVMARCWQGLHKSVIRQHLLITVPIFWTRVSGGAREGWLDGGRAKRQIPVSGERDGLRRSDTELSAPDRRQDRRFELRVVPRFRSSGFGEAKSSATRRSLLAHEPRRS